MERMTHWPLSELELITPRLRLRLPSAAELDALATVAVSGIHDPGTQPFTAAWTDGTPAEVAQRVLQYAWGTWSSWTPADWSLWLAVVHDGQAIGCQEVSARDFAVRREAVTGSWLGAAYHGQGFGTEMRAAVLHLAFETLGARHLVSGARVDNHASLAVSRKLGYVEDGIEHHVVRGEAVTLQRLRLTREAWAARRAVEVRVEGAEGCLGMFGVGAAGS